MRIYIGYDPRDEAAYNVCRATLERHCSVDIEIIPIKEWELRHKGVYWRSYTVGRDGQMWDAVDGTPFSTQFSFSRFAVPILEEYGDEWALFCDADMMFRADVAELFALADNKYGVMCVKHTHDPQEKTKMAGVIQSGYHRKNWSSLMLIKPSRCRGLTRYALNHKSGKFLHGMKWIDDSFIGEIPHEWNHLAGYDDSFSDPKNVHFTLGTPDMDHYAPTQWDDEWRRISNETN